MKNTRNTLQRALVLDAITTLSNHPTADDVYSYIAKEHPSISRGTVYRNLNLLAEHGKILRVMIPNGADRFDTRIDHHYHLRCARCGDVFDLDMPYQEALHCQADGKNGFSVFSHEIVFHGLCPNCK